MSPKKAEPQFKLNYFDIIKGVLFPRMGAPKSSAPPAMQKSTQVTSPPPPLPLQGNAPQLSAPAAKSAQKPAARQTAKTTGLGIKRDKLAPAFFNIAGILSFIVNIILIIVLVIVGRELFALKALVGDHLLGGLYSNFILMDQAHITTNIVVEDKIPVQFDLPISQQITVTLTQNTVIRNATVGVLSVPTTVTLPAGTQLPIQLDLTVPVSTTIPIKIKVPVDIPLDQTELHQPFIGLQGVVRPLYDLLWPKVRSANDVSCGLARPFCNWFFYK